ncbi:MAG: Aerotaxis receptor [Candidatus Accumulibacter sp. BA-94]|nr:MAG: Aerotaxis receptor [Candidatus Accumulibacter sp. BA-94]MDG4604846.1 methyl-accepting chemotaxis protein [Candidatus Contendobacter sp.]HRD48623.1 methyl-accepting chemotaxis protein [Candidatus Contendobacter sp.]
MRANLPVTNNEHLLDADTALVSITDLQSRIRYANPAFIAISGFSKEELIGEPHNIVRHPDMPPEAFADLWKTIESGQPWTALVKNRCKNGDYYWVKANVTPLVDGDKVTGYMSVRIKPSREEVAKANAIYEAMRTGKSNYGIRNGDVIRSDLLSKLASWTQIGIRARIWIAMLIMTLTMIGAMTIETFWLNAGADTTGVNWMSFIALSGLSLALSVVLGFWLYYSIAQPLQSVAKMAQRIAGADLTSSLSTSRQDTIGQAIRGLNQTNVNLRGVISDVRAQVYGIHQETGDIASGIHDLSSRTESQAASLEQTAASMEEIHATVQQTVNSTHQANQLALSASTIAQRGGAVVDQVVANMADINASSTRIADIISVINEIAFQTNILALNAAVEAARAGEQGKGFAVVAGEVRNLAQKTAVAAKEIKGLILDSLAKVESGLRLSEDAGKTMGELASAIQSVTTIMNEITHMSTEQVAGIGQVNEAAMQIDRVTQENAALAERVTSAAMLLNDQADALLDAVNVFNIK